MNIKTRNPDFHHFMNNSNKAIDWRTSENIAKIINARVGECVANVLRAFLDHFQILPKDSTFIEGLYTLGGQLLLHTWIETSNFIVDPTLVRRPKSLLSGRIIHCKILVRNKDELMELYGDMDRTPGKILAMKLSWNDPQVEELSHNIDLP